VILLPTAVPPEEREEIEALLRCVSAEPVSPERWRRILAAAGAPTAQRLGWGQGLFSAVVAVAMFVGLVVPPGGAWAGHKAAHSTAGDVGHYPSRPLR
jgi:hypothetical protein